MKEALTKLNLSTWVSSFLVNLTDFVTFLLAFTMCLQLMQLFCDMVYKMPYYAIFQQNRSNGFLDVTFFDFFKKVATAILDYQNSQPFLSAGV